MVKGPSLKKKKFYPTLNYINSCRNEQIIDIHNMINVLVFSIIAIILQYINLKINMLYILHLYNFISDIFKQKTDI